MRVRTIALMGAGGLILFQSAFTAGMLQLEGHDGFCTACHLHEEKRAAMLRPAREVGQLTARHYEVGVGCAECHREPGALGRVTTLYTLGVRDTLRFLSGDYAEPERLTVHLKNDLCIECHGETIARRGDVDSYHGNRHHNARQDIRCTSCHLHHKPGDPDYAYLDLRAFEAGCTSCHVGLYDVEPVQQLEPATGEFSRMREILRRKGVKVK